MHKLILSVVSPFAIVAMLIAASEAKQTPITGISWIMGGFGDHECPAHSVNPELPVLRHEVNHYYDATSDRIMTYEEIEYEDGSATSKIGPHRSDLDRQNDPHPLNIQPPPCTLVTQSASNQGNATTGTFHLDALVLCQMNGGLQSCPKVGFNVGLYKLQQDGTWTQVNYLQGTSPMNLLCNGTARPFFDVSVPGSGTFKCRWYGYDTAKNFPLWDLTTQIDYAG